MRDQLRDKLLHFSPPCPRSGSTNIMQNVLKQNAIKMFEGFGHIRAAAKASHMALQTFLASSLISGVVAALISGAAVLRSKHTEYRNEYYKLVLQRRVAAYEAVERLIISLKTAILDSDGRAYHILFSDNQNIQNAHNLVAGLMLYALWLSDSIFSKGQELNRLMFTLQEGKAIEFGKKNYETIASIRAEIERLLAVDMLRLYDIKTFLKEKNKKDPGVQVVRLGDKAGGR